MSFRVTVHDEAGMWAMGGETDLSQAKREARSMVETRSRKGGEKWTRVTPPMGVIAMWQNTKGDTIKVVST